MRFREEVTKKAVAKYLLRATTRGYFKHIFVVPSDHLNEISGTYIAMCAGPLYTDSGSYWRKTDQFAIYGFKDDSDMLFQKMTHPDSITVNVEQYINKQYTEDTDD